MSDDEKTQLLRMCFKLFEEIRADEWTVCHGNSIEIAKLITQIRPFITPAIPFDEVQCISFRCPSCQAAVLEVLRSLGCEWDYIACTCNKRYRVEWKRDGNEETYVMEAGEIQA